MIFVPVSAYFEPLLRAPGARRVPARRGGGPEGQPLSRLPPVLRRARARAEEPEEVGRSGEGRVARHGATRYPPGRPALPRLL